MNSKPLKYNLFLGLFLVIISVQAQSYTKDSLQIKVYTEIKYTNSIADSIKLKKVFCDYCSKTQLKALGEEGLRRAHNEKYYPENKLRHGIKKLAIYIRVAKKDLAAIKDED